MGETIFDSESYIPKCKQNQYTELLSPNCYPFFDNNFCRDGTSIL